jgi:hypothetical protein
MAAPEASTRPRATAKPADALMRAIIGPLFLVLAAGLFVTRDQVSVPHVTQVPVSRQDITTDPLRLPLPDPPWIAAGGYELTCMECHRLFESLPDTPRRLMHHLHIALDHGLNDRCLNCHDRDDRNRLVLSSGETIPFAESPSLCAECHGTTWRDWQRRVHGRTDDYWDATWGPPRTLSCVECHDPHVPAIGPMRPLPGPRTLRMGEPRRDRHAAAVGKRNPLRHWGPRRSREHTAPGEPADDDANEREAP